MRKRLLVFKSTLTHCFTIILIKFHKTPPQKHIWRVIAFFHPPLLPKKQAFVLCHSTTRLSLETGLPYGTSAVMRWRNELPTCDGPAQPTTVNGTGKVGKGNPAVNLCSV